jgi:Mg-chelatase subunit ChlD
VFLLRAAAVAALAVTLAEPRRSAPDAGPVLIVGLDVSESFPLVGGDPATLLTDALGGWEPPADVRTAVVAFGESPQVLRPLSPGLPTAAELEGVRLGRGATDLAAAVRTMRGLAPGRGDVRLLLITDGRDTAGDPLAAVPATGGPPIFVWAGGFTPAADARIAGVRAPARVAPGQRFAGNVTVAGNSGLAVTVRVVRTGGASPPVEVARVPTEIRPDEPGAVRFDDAIAAAGTHAYSVELLGPDGRPLRDAVTENNRFTASVTVAGNRRVLLVTDDPGGVAAQAVRAVPGAEVEVRTAAGVPESAADLAAFESVVLDDVATDAAAPEVLSARRPERLLTPAKARALAEYVRGYGGGLVAIGGPGAFGPGGYHRSPVHEVLPVDSDPRSRNPTAVMLVLDRSGSMNEPVGNRRKWQVVRDAVAALRPVLNARDELGVIAFAGEPTVVREPAADIDWPKLSRALEELVPFGETRMIPALRAAAGRLAGTKAETKRLLVVSDGQSEDIRRDPAARAELSEMLRRSGIRLSAVIAGDEPAAEIRALAEATGGGFFAPADFAEVPEKLLADLYRSGDFVRTGDLAVSVGDAGPLALPATPPPIAKLLRTVARPDAKTALTAPGGDPVLAYGPAGLGRSAALTTGFAPGWADAWRDGAAPLMRTILDWTMRPAADPDWRLTAEVRGRSVRLRLDSVGVPPANERPVRAVFAGPGAPQPAPLLQTAPGRYEAEIPVAGQGSLSVAAVLDGPEPRVLARAGFTTGHRPEISEVGFAEPMLSRLAARTGGRLIYSLSDLADWGRAAAGRSETLTGWAIAALLIALSAETLLQIALRKGWARGL